MWDRPPTCNLRRLPTSPFTVQAESIFGATLSSNPVQVYVK
jgi:hypothetical protein